MRTGRGRSMHQRSWTLLARLPWRTAGRRAAAPTPDTCGWAGGISPGCCCAATCTAHPMTCWPRSWTCGRTGCAAIVARWRRAGLRRRPGGSAPGPAWCWLTRTGLAATGLRYAPPGPSLGRLAHIRAVLAVRLSLEASDAYRDGRAWWRSERRIRAAAGGRVRTGPCPRRRGVLARGARQPLPGRVLGDRGRADAQAASPHDRDHDRAAGPHRGLQPRRAQPGPGRVMTG